MRLKCMCLPIYIFNLFLLREKPMLKDTNVPINKLQI